MFALMRCPLVCVCFIGIFSLTTVSYASPKYAVQIGAFKERDSALRLSRMAEDELDVPSVILEESVGDVAFYKVLCGGFSSDTELSGGNYGTIVPLPPPTN